MYLPTPKMVTPIISSAIVLATLLAGCRPNHLEDTSDAPGPAPAITKQLTENDIRVTLTVSPGDADLTADNLMSLEIEAPAEIDIQLPSVASRLTGLTAPNGTFDDPVVTANGTTLWRRHARLVPVVATEYRMAPLIIHYTDTSTSPPREGWFTTPPLVLELRPLTSAAASSITTRLPYRWVRPPNKTFLIIGAWIILGVATLAALIVLIRRMHKKTVLARLTPRERALAELNKLLGAHLLEADRTKDFYVELTMVVRRYIERQHQVRAPEQTTEEFLAWVTEDPRFSKAVLDRLRSFLQAADLVKFAAYNPDGADVDHAVDTARDYVETDANSASQLQGGA
jgi:hypothetical protein